MTNKLVALVVSFALSLAFLGFVPCSEAQVLFGSVSGVVTDPSGAGVPKAHVVIVTNEGAHLDCIGEAVERGGVDEGGLLQTGVLGIVRGDVGQLEQR